MGNTWLVAAGLEGMAAVAMAQGNAARAARLSGAAAALRADLGLIATPNEQAAIARVTSAGRDALGQAAFAAAWEVGRRLLLPQAIEEAAEVQT